MAVSNADIIAGKREKGRPANVEADIELGNLHNGFFTRDAVADDVHRAESNSGEFLNEKGFLHRFFGHDASLGAMGCAGKGGRSYAHTG